VSVLGGYQNVSLPVPTSVASDGFFRLELAQAVPTLNLRWLLLDFGRRGNARDAAKERLLAANLGFNRQHQQVAFAVQRAFYGLTSIRARIAVAQSSLDAARTVQDSTESRLTQGLATRPEAALARQQAAQAMFDLEDVLAKERDAQVTLAESIGIPPTTPIQVTDFSDLPAGTDLQKSVEKTIDRALEKRPHLPPPGAALRPCESAPRTGRLCRSSGTSARSWVRHGSPRTASRPRGSGRASPATASGSTSRGKSSTAVRGSAGSSWPRRRVDPRRTRSPRRAIAR